MKNIFFYVIFYSMLSTSVHAQELDLDSDDLISYEDNQNEDSESNNNPDEYMQSVDVENTGSKSGGFFSFITRPISSLTSSKEDDNKNEENTKKTPLEKLIERANAGYAEDQSTLGYMYLYGINGVEQDFDEAFKYYALASEQNDAIALNNLGSLYFNGIGTGVDYKKAMSLFEKASSLGNDSAATNLAFIYLTGGKKDEMRSKKAIDLFKKASEKGNKLAKFMLGYAYYKGFIVEKDYAQAFSLISNVANSKSSFDEAQLVLAYMYMNGYGTVQNYAESIKYYKEAATQGNLEAVYNLAKIYDNGTIAPQSLINAHTWYNYAASMGVSGAAKERDRVSKKMKYEEISAAQAAAQNFAINVSEFTNYVRQSYGDIVRKYIDNNITTEQIVDTEAHKEKIENKNNKLLK